MYIIFKEDVLVVSLYVWCSLKLLHFCTGHFFTFLSNTVFGRVSANTLKKILLDLTIKF